MVKPTTASLRCDRSVDDEGAQMVAEVGARWPVRRARVWRVAETWVATVHLLTDLPMGMVVFIPTLLGLTLSLGLLPLFLSGLLVLVVTGWMANGLAVMERGRFALILGVRITDPRPPKDPDAPKGVVQWFNRRISASHTWRAISYHLLLLPRAGITFVLVIALWSGPLALITLPIYNWALPNGGANLWLFTVRSVLATVLTALLGVALFLLAPWAVRGLASLDIAIARALLGPNTVRELTARVGRLEESRARVVDSAEAERRRIERDLHDGAQQRLVALAMNLGRARARYEEDPEAARALLDEAHTEAKQALVELRNLARGIHPAVLTDRGLDAALSGLAARSPVPVTVEVDVGARPSSTIEAIAYFVVAETLANTAKHAKASRAWVVVRRLNSHIQLTITDNGIGGADLRSGTGLAGLADRVSGVDGRFSVLSPVGGPTVITAELPCE
jgi:signal transduction histidine kinase